MIVKFEDSFFIEDGGTSVGHWACAFLRDRDDTNTQVWVARNLVVGRKCQH